MPFRASDPSVTQLTRALLAKARDQGINDVGPTKVLGLLYLLDVEHWARYAEPATHIPWVWKDFGPFDRQTAYGPRSDPQVEVIPSPGPYDGEVYRIRVGDVEQLESRIDGLLTDVVESKGRWTAKTIKRFCYEHTAPMRAIQETGRKGDKIDMSVARVDSPPSPDAVAEIKGATDALGHASHPNPQHSDDFVALVDESSDLRRRANTTLLDNT